MKPVDQQCLTEDGEIGDCVRASTCSILEIGPDDVPHFVKEHGGNWQFAWEEWLYERGLVVLAIDPRDRPKCFYLACGPTIRTNGFRPSAHMVVMNGREIVHDPHPSRAGLTTIDRVYVLTPKDPAVITTEGEVP